MDAAKQETSGLLMMPVAEYSILLSFAGPSLRVRTRRSLECLTPCCRFNSERFCPVNALVDDDCGDVVLLIAAWWRPEEAIGVVVLDRARRTWLPVEILAVAQGVHMISSSLWKS